MRHSGSARHSGTGGACPRPQRGTPPARESPGVSCWIRLSVWASGDRKGLALYRRRRSCTCSWKSHSLVPHRSQWRTSPLREPPCCTVNFVPQERQTWLVSIPISITDWRSGTCRILVPRASIPMVTVACKPRLSRQGSSGPAGPFRQVESGRMRHRDAAHSRLRVSGGRDRRENDLT